MSPILAPDALVIAWVTGADKADILNKALNRDITEIIPFSLCRLKGDNFIVIADEKAAEQLGKGRANYTLEMA